MLFLKVDTTTPGVKLRKKKYPRNSKNRPVAQKLLSILTNDLGGSMYITN